MQNAPDGSDHATQVRAVLDAEQLKKVEAKEAAQAKEREEMQQRFPMMRMGAMAPALRAAAVMVQPANPPADPNDKPKEKDKDGRAANRSSRPSET
jgi:negative regulator of sigma E activity